MALRDINAHDIYGVAFRKELSIEEAKKIFPDIPGEITTTITEQDHEFPWIFRVANGLICGRCLMNDDIANWLDFLEKHSKCPMTLGHPDE